MLGMLNRTTCTLLQEFFAIMHSLKSDGLEIGLVSSTALSMFFDSDAEIIAEDIMALSISGRSSMIIQVR